MATMTAVKSGPIEETRTQFRTQMVNGKPQIYFDVLEEPTEKPKPKRTSRPVNAVRQPEQAKPKPVSQKPVPQNPTNRPPKKPNRVTFNDEPPKMGVYMTMDDIAELVKAVKESNNTQNPTTTVEYKEPSPPPPPPTYQQEPSEFPTVVEVPRSDVPPLPQPLAPISPRQEALGMMAEKKRQKWMREKAEMDRMKLEVEYDQLKHQLSPVHQKTSLSPERTTIPADYSKPPLPPSNKPNDNAQTRLMEKKQQQWKQENAEKAPVWNPFGRPGAGAPNTNELPPKTSQATPSNIVMPYRPPDSSSLPSNIVLNDQTRVPAAMRTNLIYGDVRFDDDVKVAKELERRQWLDDLRKQIEENKRQKFTQQETERRQDFLHENVQPLIQEASQRQEQKDKDKESTTLLNTNRSNTTQQDVNRTSRHDTIVQHTYDKIVEATELAKYEKKAQLIEKLKRNGHKTDLLAKTLPDVKSLSPVSTKKSNEKPIESSSTKKSMTTKVEPLQLNMANDQQQSYRNNDARRDEGVNTIDSTFRSDNSVQTDVRMSQHKPMFPFTREGSDLPAQMPPQLLKTSRQTNKKNVRIRSLEDQRRQQNSHSHQSPRDDNISTHRSNNPTLELLSRPLWNYQNPEHREYVPNSKRDPYMEKRQRQQQQQGNANRMAAKQKPPPYNRWKSDSDIQHESKDKKVNANNRTGSTNLKQRDGPIINSSKGQRFKEDTFIISNNDDNSGFNNMSSLDKYDHFTPYIRTDEILDPARAFSPLPFSREPSAHKPRTIIYDDHQRRQNANVQPPPYHVPPSRQDHILQQLTAIKENLVRRQQEVATSMNAIPV